MTALFVDRHHSTFTFHAGNLAFRNGTAFVNHRIEPDALVLEVFRGQNHAVATNLFIVGRTDVQVDSFKFIALCQKFLHGL